MSGAGAWDRARALTGCLVDEGLIDMSGDDNAATLLLNAGLDGTIRALEDTASTPEGIPMEAPFDVPGEAEAFLSSREAYATGFFVAEMLNCLLSGDVDYPDFDGDAFSDLDSAIEQRSEDDPAWRRLADDLRRKLIPDAAPCGCGGSGIGRGLAEAVATAILGFPPSMYPSEAPLRPEWFASIHHL